jgi:hypothetical protein
LTLVRVFSARWKTTTRNTGVIAGRQGVALALRRQRRGARRSLP